MDTYISGGTREERKKRKDDKKERRRSKRREKRERRMERRMSSSDSDSSNDANIQVYWGLLQRQQALAKLGGYLAKIQQYNGSVAKKDEVNKSKDEVDKSKEEVVKSKKEADESTEEADKSTDDYLKSVHLHDLSTRGDNQKSKYHFQNPTHETRLTDEESPSRFHETFHLSQSSRASGTYPDTKLPIYSSVSENKSSSAPFTDTSSFTFKSTAASSAPSPSTAQISAASSSAPYNDNPPHDTFSRRESLVSSLPIVASTVASRTTAAVPFIYTSASASQSLLSKRLGYFYNIFDSGKSNLNDLNVITNHFYDVLTHFFTKEFMDDTDHGQTIFTLFNNTKNFIIKILDDLFFTIDTHLFEEHNYNNCTFFSEEDAHYQTHSRFFMYVNGLRILYGIDFLRKPGYIRTDEDNRYYTDFIDNYKKYYDKFVNFAKDVPYPIPSSTIATTPFLQSAQSDKQSLLSTTLRQDSPNPDPSQQGYSHLINSSATTPPPQLEYSHTTQVQLGRSEEGEHIKSLFDTLREEYNVIRDKCESIKQQYNKIVTNYMDTKKDPNQALQIANKLKGNINDLEPPAKELATKLEKLTLLDALENMNRTNYVTYLRMIPDIIISLARHNAFLQILNTAIQEDSLKQS